jgi:hypothetical protein
MAGRTSVGKQARAPKLLLFYSALTLPAVVGEPRAAQNE